mgnify:CR=1 FL=1
MIRRPVHETYYAVIDQKTGLLAAGLSTSCRIITETCTQYNSRKACVTDPGGKLVPRYRVGRFRWVPPRLSRAKTKKAP